MDVLFSAVLHPMAGTIAMATTSAFTPKQVIQPVTSDHEERQDSESMAKRGFIRTADFWRRVGGIYVRYQYAQAVAAYFRLRGRSPEDIESTHWEPYYDVVGREMYSICVDMRGMLLKTGQMIGARSDFVPEGICAHLRQLQDQVPPMPPAQTEAILLKELNIASLSEVFEWIDLSTPLGSASIAQVHKAKLRSPETPQPRPITKTLSAPFRATGSLFRHLTGRAQRQHDSPHRSPGSSQCEVAVHTVNSTAESAWTIANTHGVSMQQLRDSNAHNKEVNLGKLEPGDVVALPTTVPAKSGGETEGNTQPQAPQGSSYSGIRRFTAPRDLKDGLVAVKVQYPDAKGLFSQDLVNVRLLARMLTWSQIAKFDFVSAIDELSAQIKLEFDFTREARVMDQTHENLKHLRGKVEIPYSIPSLVTERVFAMKYLDGSSLQHMRNRAMKLSLSQRKVALKMIITRIADAYGCMMLMHGLFQADAHPGNMLILPNGAVGLIDYGQSKQLSDKERRLLAQLLLALARGTDEEISAAFTDLGVETKSSDPKTRSKLARTLFDTAGPFQPPFAPGGALHDGAITELPAQFFMVVRIVQLIRALRARLDLDFSAAKHWESLAQNALNEVNAGTS